MEHTILTFDQGSKLSLSLEQHGQIDWRDDDGPEPDSGYSRHRQPWRAYSGLRCGEHWSRPLPK